MAWLCALAILLPLNKHPTEAQEQGAIPGAVPPMASEAHAAVDAANQTPSATSKRTTPANEHQDDDRSIQRKLAWFTGALVVVGLLQTDVMFLTWLIYRRQAHEMRRQRHEMRRQRHVMFRQWKAMSEQLRQMEVSGKQTDELIKHASAQVTALSTSAQAAKQNAEAAQINAAASQSNALAASTTASALINTERAWVLIDIQWHASRAFFARVNDNTGNENTGIYIDLLCINEGRSPAWIVEQRIRAEVTNSPSFDPRLDESDTQFVESNQPIAAKQKHLTEWRLFAKGWNNRDVYVYGVVKYRDIFTFPPQKPRETWFGFLVSASGGIGRMLAPSYNRNT